MKDIRLTMYLPSRDRHGNNVEDIDYWVDEACVLFCGLNGGATYLIGYGVYQTRSGALIRERTHIIYSISTGDQRAITTMRSFLDRFGLATEQEAILYEIGSAHFFHTPTGDHHHGHLLATARPPANTSAAAGA